MQMAHIIDYKRKVLCDETIKRTVNRSRTCRTNWARLTGFFSNIMQPRCFPLSSVKPALPILCPGTDYQHTVGRIARIGMVDSLLEFVSKI